MVIFDPYSPSTSVEIHSWQSDEASPNQRILAMVLDLAILSPVFTLLLSGLYQQLKMQVYLGDVGPERGEVWVLWIISYYFLWTVTTVGFIAFQGHTPGGKFMQLKLVNFKGQAPSLVAIAIRQMSFPLHLLFLGSSLFEVYFHDKHLAFHEKVSETRWQSGYMNLFFSIGALEKKMVLSFVHGALIFSSMIFAITLFSKYEGVRNLSFSRKQYLSEQPMCEKVVSRFASRDMSDLIFLNQTKFLSDSCLKKEIDLALYSSLQDPEKKAWSYLALAGLTDDGGERENYEKLLCEQESQACRLLKFRKSQSTTELAGFKDHLLFKYYQIVNSIHKKHFAEALRLYQALQVKVGEEIEALRLPILVSWADQQVHIESKAKRSPTSVKSSAFDSVQVGPQESADFILRQWEKFQQDLSL